VLKYDVQNFSHLVQGEHLQIWGLNEGGRKFSGKLAISWKL